MMKDRYRMFCDRSRFGTYYAVDNTTGKRQSLNTKDEAEAKRLLLGMNEAHKQPAMNKQMARVYLQHSDAMVNQRTWQHVLDEICKIKKGENQMNGPQRTRPLT